MSGERGVTDTALLSIIRRGHLRRHISIRRDRTAHVIVAQHDPQVPVVGYGRAEVYRSSAGEQAGPVCREAIGLVADRSWQAAQTAAPGQADARGSRGSGLRCFLQPRGGFRAGVRGWKAGRQRDAKASGRGTFAPLVFQPGEAFRFDWSEEWAMTAGTQIKRVSPTCLISFERNRYSGPASFANRPVSGRPRPISSILAPPARRQ